MRTSNIKNIQFAFNDTWTIATDLLITPNQESFQDEYLKKLTAEFNFLKEHLPHLAEKTFLEFWHKYLMTDGSPVRLRNRCDILSCHSRLLDQRDLLHHELAQDRKNISPLSIESPSFGEVQIVWEDDTAGVYRLLIDPHKKIAAHYHKSLDEVELVLSNHLALFSKKLDYGDSFNWPRFLVHEYHNTSSDQVAGVLCIDKPSFIPEDEITVDYSAEALIYEGQNHEKQSEKNLWSECFLKNYFF